MKFDQGTLNSPYPIPLSMGTLKKPTLESIAKPPMSFQRFYYYEALAVATPKSIFTESGDKDGLEKWASFSIQEQVNMTVFDLIYSSKEFQKEYLEMLNFFFEENIVYVDNTGFVTLNPNKDYSSEGFSREDIIGIIDRDNFDDVLNFIQQVCCITPEEPEKVVYKNKTAENLDKLFQQQEAEMRKNSKADKNLTLTNIVSKVAANHNSINYLNVYRLTVPQILDNFRTLQNIEIYRIERTRVSVWGDEKKTFDSALWYKNDYDKNAN